MYKGVRNVTFEKTFWAYWLNVPLMLVCERQYNTGHHKFCKDWETGKTKLLSNENSDILKHLGSILGFPGKSEL